MAVKYEFAIPASESHKRIHGSDILPEADGYTRLAVDLLAALDLVVSECGFVETEIHVVEVEPNDPNLIACQHPSYYLYKGKLQRA